MAKRGATQDPNLTRLGDARVWIQTGLRSPIDPYEYVGCATITGVGKPQGDTTSVECPSSERRNAWDIVDTIPSAPELGTADFEQRANRFLNDIWWDIVEEGTIFNLQIALDREGRPTKFNQWESKIALREARLTDFTLPDFNPLAGGDNGGGSLTGSFSFRDLVRIKTISFAELAAAIIDTELVDGDYAEPATSGASRRAGDRNYWLQIATAVPAGSEVVHTRNGNTYVSIPINTIGTASGSALRVVGDDLVVAQETGTPSYHYASLDDIDNDVATPFAQVTAGFVATKGPRAIWSKSPTKTYFASAGGYMYLLPEPGAAVVVLSAGEATIQDMNAIAGFGQVVVAVGDANAILLSTNDGDTWSAKVGPAVGVDITAIDLISEDIWFVGMGNGASYVTLDRGDTWALKGIDAGVTVVRSIAFYDDIVGYAAVQVGATVGRVYRTTDGGNSWQATAPSLKSPVAMERANVVRTPRHNEVAVGGLRSGTDGILAVAS